MKHWKAWVGLVLLFVVGFAAGFLVCGGIVKHRLDDLMTGDMRVMNTIIMHKLERHLDLTEEQQVQVHRELQEGFAEFEVLRQEHFPKVKALINKTAMGIESRLDPEQQKEFRELFHDFKQFHPALQE